VAWSGDVGEVNGVWEGADPQAGAGGRKKAKRVEREGIRLEIALKGSKKGGRDGKASLSYNSPRRKKRVGRTTSMEGGGRKES